MALDVTKPADDTPVSQLPAAIRETRANLKNNLVTGALFEPGTEEGDAVYFDASSNLWRRSLAGDPQRGRFFGIAKVDESAVQTVGYAEGEYSFISGQSVYVSAEDMGKFVTTETLITAGRAISVSGFLIDAMTSVAVSEVQEEVIAARGGEASLDARLDDMDQLRNQVTQEVNMARGIAANLNARMSVSLNQDGTLKTTTTALAWVEESETFSRAGSTTFLVIGVDKSAVYAVGRAVRFNASEVAYVASVSYNSADTVVNITGNTIPATLVNVEYGLDVTALPKISHNTLNAVDGADPVSSDGTKNKHVSNLMTKLWNDHIGVTAGNPHGTTAADVGADPSGTAATTVAAAISAHNAGTGSHGLDTIIWPMDQGGLGQAFADVDEIKEWLGIGDAFPAGTKMLFVQTTAPTGWTKQTTHNDKALRVVSGTAGSGGTVAFSTVFSRTATDDHTLTTAQMPSHTHTVQHIKGGIAGDSVSVASGESGYTPTSWVNSGLYRTLSNGSGGSHQHNIDLQVQYVDTIIAQKDA